MIIFLKEKWQAWQFINKPDILKSILKKLKKNPIEEDPIDEGHNKKDQDRSMITSKQKGGNKREEKTIELPDEFQEDIQRHCNVIKSSLFSAVIKLDLNQIKHMKIHRGKDPSIELLCGPVEDSRQESQYCCKIMFTGDMERQRFVETLMAEKKGFDQGGDGSTDKDGDDSSYGGGDEERSESDEDAVNAVIYE